MDAATIETFGLPGRVLMENAGRGATRFFLESIYHHHPGDSIAVVAGRGNNGGDGFVMARYLAQKQIPVRVYLLSTRTRVGGDAAANLDLLDPMGIPITEIPDIDAFNSLKPELHHQKIWIDAILGTGLSSDVKGLYKEAIDFINASNRPVFSVDIPSGLDSDTGQPCGTCIRATACATFAFAKLGHVVYPGVKFVGNLSIVEIGIPPYIAADIGTRHHLLTPETLQNRLITRKAEAHKGTTGHLLVASGSTGKTGAAAMTAMSALKSGAGLVTLAVAESLNPILENLVLEAMTAPLPETSPGRLGKSALSMLLDLCQGKRCMALGPGLGTLQDTHELVFSLIEQVSIPLVIDADGLNILSLDIDVLKKAKAPIVLTPHPGEMSRLLNKKTPTILQDRAFHARYLAETYGVHIVLKGARSIVAAPDGQIYVNPTGNPGMASGGMGDVLTGIIAGLITQGYEPGDAACIGTYLHGAAGDSLAGEESPIGFLAGQVIERLPLEIGKWLKPHYSNLPSEDPLGYQTQ